MTFKFISLNIWNGGTLFDKAIDFLHKENADIIAIQEAHDGTDTNLGKRYRTIEVLKKELKLDYNSFAPSFGTKVDNKIMNFGNAILSRFPITPLDIIFYDVPYNIIDINKVDYSYIPRNLQHAKLTIGESSINIFNTHGVWGTDDKDNSRRHIMCNTIVRRIKGVQNVILAGDLNIDQDSEAIQGIEKELINVFKHELKTSFNPKHKREGNFHDSVVDFIFASNSLKVVDHYCPQVDVSDHLPLVTVFELTWH